MNSRIAGTGASSLSTGRHMRAARRVPSLIGIRTYSSSRTWCGSVSTVRMVGPPTRSVAIGVLDVEAQCVLALLVHALGLFGAVRAHEDIGELEAVAVLTVQVGEPLPLLGGDLDVQPGDLLLDRKSTRLNSSHVAISYAVF